MLNSTRQSRILIQGIDQPAAAATLEGMLQAGANLVAGVLSQVGPESPSPTIPCFDLVEQAQAAAGPMDVALLFNPPWQILDASLEAMAGGIRQLIIATRGVPPLDGVQLVRYARQTKSLILGSGSAGMMRPQSLMLGSFRDEFFHPGNVGLICRSESLAYEVATELHDWQLGQSVVIHLGSDSIVGSPARTWLELLAQDKATKAIVLVGDIPRDLDLQTTAHQIGKRVVAYRPQLHQGLAPLSEAAQLLGAARRARSSVQGPSPAPAATEYIKVAQSIHQLPELLKY